MGQSVKEYRHTFVAMLKAFAEYAHRTPNAMQTMQTRASYAIEEAAQTTAPNISSLSHLPLHSHHGHHAVIGISLKI